MVKKAKGDSEDEKNAPILNIFFEESDRGCVLAGAAFLADDVEHLLRYVFHMRSELTEKEVDELLAKGSKPPLQSAWLKTEMACAFGVIPKYVRGAINSVGTLRNKFAHKSGYRVLRQGHLDGVLSHLKPLSNEIQREQGVIEMCMEEVGESRQFSEARMTFMACILVLQGCCSRAIRELD